MGNYEHVDIMICTDCIMYVANGVLPSESWGSESDDHGVMLGESRLGGDGWYVHAGNPDNYDTFSMVSCDMCANHLHGSRHHAVMWREVESENVQ